MSVNASIPNYDLDDELELTTADQVRALADPLRMSVLDLLRERAASITELARAVGRPKSTVAYHVRVLVEAGLVRVVWTRRVRAIDERFYGRTARMVYTNLGGQSDSGQEPLDFNDLAVAAKESVPAYQARQLRGFIRHARIPPERATEFWEGVMQLVRELDLIPRSGDTVYGFAVGLYPTDYPTLPEKQD